MVLPFIRSPHLRYRPTTHQSPSAISRLPAYISFVFWPVALLILGVRLKTLNELAPSPPPLPPVDVPAKVEIMGLSIWGGISLLVFSLSAHQDTFKFITSLARPPSTATRSTRSPSVGRAGDSSAAHEGRRNQWPIASAIGVGGAVLIQMGWGLVGYLGIDGGGREGNLFASAGLPRADPWLVVVRVLVLGAILATLDSSLESAYARTRKAIVLGFGKGAAARGGANKNAYARIGNEEERRGWDWRTASSRVVVWAAVVAIAVVATAGGEQGEGLVSVAELAGCIASSLLAFLGPCASPWTIVTTHTDCHPYQQPSSSSRSSTSASRAQSSSPTRTRPCSRPTRSSCARSAKSSGACPAAASGWTSSSLVACSRTAPSSCCAGASRLRPRRTRGTGRLSNAGGQ